MRPARIADLPVAADPWFVIESAGDGITLVTEPHVHPFIRCNVWHVAGRDQDLVVDSALGLAPLRGLVERELAGPLLAVATHGHRDHVALVEQPGGGGRGDLDHTRVEPRVGQGVDEQLAEVVPRGPVRVDRLPERGGQQ